MTCAGASEDEPYVDVGPCIRLRMDCNQYCNIKGYQGGHCWPVAGQPNHCFCLDPPPNVV